MVIADIPIDFNFHSREWASIKSYLLATRQILLEMNSVPMSEVETAMIRGRIQQVSDLLNLEETREIGNNS